MVVTGIGTAVVVGAESSGLESVGIESSVGAAVVSTVVSTAVCACVVVALAGEATGAPVVVVGAAAVVDTGLDAGLLDAALDAADVVVTGAELVACAGDGEDDAADDATEDDAADGAEVVTGAALVGVVVGVAVCVEAADAGDWLLVGAALVAVVLLGDALVPVCSADVDADVGGAVVVAAEGESLGDGAVGTLVGGATAGTSSAAVSGTV